MATWQDGPEYAPTARPDEFAEPQVAPLEEPPAAPAPAGAPLERPRFSEPAAPVAPLETLVPVPADVRDPSLAFDVVSSTLTSGGPWGGIHGAHPAAGPVDASPVQQGGPSWPGASPGPSWPNGPPAPTTSAPFPGSAPFPSTSPYGPSGFPEPGTPQWFGPGPYGEQPSRGRADARTLWAAATPALLIVLVVAILIKVLAPLLLIAAFILARRVQVGRVWVQRAFLIALGTVGTFALIGLFTGPLGIGDWWSFVGNWSRWVSLAVLVSTVLLVRHALLRGETPSPPSQSPPPDIYRGPWG